MEERAERFHVLSDSWMERMFPAVDSGVRITVSGWDYSLTSTLLQKDAAMSGEGYTPAYLKASGRAELVMESSSGKASRPVDVEADAGSAFPLTAQRGSLFAHAASGDGSLLSQLMTYQLTSLAQYRVLNGYGSGGYYGDTGTASILTNDDIRESYESCLGAVSSVYLSSPDGEWSGTCDAASVLMSGELTLDLNMIYAQALYGVVDDITLRWAEYFGGKELISLLDDVADTFADIWGKVTSFLTGKNTDSAEDYIEDVCGDVGYDVCEDQSFTLTLDDGTEITIPYPERDIMDLDAVTSFYSDYRHSVNGLQDWLTEIINDAVTSVADAKKLGVLRFSVGSDEAFPEALCSRAIAAAEGSLYVLEGALEDAVRSTEFHDRLSSAVWYAVDGSRAEDLLCDISTFAEECGTIIQEETGTDIDTETLLSNQSFLDAHASWVQDVDRILDGMRPLLTVEAKNSGIIRDGCIHIVKSGLHLADLMIDMGPKIREICREFADNISVCGASGLREYPSADGLILTDGASDNRIWLESKTESSPRVSVSVDPSECVHGTSVGDSDVASFTTVWKISLKDELRFTVRSSDTASSASGTTTSEFSDSIAIDTELTVSAVSGWALIGIEYHPSNTLKDDVIGIIFSALSELVEPLLDLMRSLQEIMAVLNDTVSMLCGIAQNELERILGMLRGPIDVMNDAIVSKLTDSGCRAIMDILENLERTYSITLSNQTVNLTYGGWGLKLTFYLGTMTNYTKHLVKATLTGNVGGADFSATVDVKVKGSDEYTPMVTGKFSAKGDDWDVEGTVDPMMVSHSFMLEMAGNIRGTGFMIDLPVLEQYREVDLSLCDIPAVGLLLSDIPFLIPGTSVSLDAGLDIRYNAPITSGIIINEAEANPPGNDRDAEWAEILNLSSSRADLGNWTLTTSKNKEYVFPEGTALEIGERIVVAFPGMFLNNTSETLTLSDSDGLPVSKVKLVDDRADDSRTCQRPMDGMTKWGLFDGTPDARNSGGLFGKDGTVTEACLEILRDAAVRAIGELGGKVTTEEGMADLIRLTFTYALDEGIDRISDMLVEASLYLKVEFSDISSTATLLGFRVHLTADKTLAGDVLRYLVGRTAEMVFNIEDPYGIDIGTSASDNIFLGVTVYTGHGLPAFLDPSGDKDVRVGADVSLNISAVRKAMGSPSGTPRIAAGIAAFNIPSAAIPAFMKADPKLTSDLWLFRLTLYPEGL
ncbi:MAG: lamin tail domain-containing protein [Thermoplasmata archaeon]|nr:lamin tail domain-containing protein [Thermoplasmata archaeon]